MTWNLKIQRDPSFGSVVDISALIRVEGKSIESFKNGSEWFVQRSQCESQENEDYWEAKEFSAGWNTVLLYVTLPNQIPSKESSWIRFMNLENGYQPSQQHLTIPID